MNDCFRTVLRRLRCESRCSVPFTVVACVSLDASRPGSDGRRVPTARGREQAPEAAGAAGEVINRFSYFLHTSTKRASLLLRSETLKRPHTITMSEDFLVLFSSPYTLSESNLYVSPIDKLVRLHSVQTILSPTTSLGVGGAGHLHLVAATLTSLSSSLEVSGSEKVENPLLMTMTRVAFLTVFPAHCARFIILAIPFTPQQRKALMLKLSPGSPQPLAVLVPCTHSPIRSLDPPPSQCGSLISLSTCVFVQNRREKAAMRRRQAAFAAADDAVESSRVCVVLCKNGEIGGLAYLIFQRSRYRSRSASFDVYPISTPPEPHHGMPGWT